MRRRNWWRLTAGLILLASSSGLGQAEPFQKTPPDSAGHWAAAEIEAVIDLGLMKGYPDGRFGPEDRIKRGEVYVILTRLLGASPLPSGTPPGFPEGHWALPYANALISHGILVPAEDRSAGELEKPISRADIARLLVRAKGEREPRQAANRLVLDIANDARSPWITAAIASGLMTGYENGSFDPSGTLTRAQAAVVARRLLEPSARPPLWRERYSYTLPTGGNVHMNVVRVNLRHPRIAAKVIQPSEGVGHTKTLAAMAVESGAVAALNGTYLAAYSDDKIKDPYGTIIQQGRVTHLGGKGPAIGFWPDGSARLGPFEKSFTGSVNGKWQWPNTWFVYGINHKPTHWGTDYLALFTADRGTDMGFNGGTSVIVRQGKVTEITSGQVPIPPDGLVINMSGLEEQTYRDRFQIGTSVDWRVDLSPQWQGVQELLQVGPMLLQGGKPDIDMARDGFSEQKITEWAASRSAVGLTADGILMLVTTSAVKVADLVPIMRDLGAVDAMCMDGGGSSGLWYRGQSITTPGRQLTNGLGIYLRD
jgi:hypothetical protein